MDTPPSQLLYALTHASCWRHVPSIIDIQPHRMLPGFVAEPEDVWLTDVDASPAAAKPSTPPCLSLLLPGCLLDRPPSHLTRPMLSSSHTCTLALLCTTWIANDSARTPWVSQSKPILLAFTLHHPWSIGMNLSLNLHCRQPSCCILRLYITSEETQHTTYIVHTPQHQHLQLANNTIMHIGNIN